MWEKYSRKKERKTRENKSNGNQKWFKFRIEFVKAKNNDFERRLRNDRKVSNLLIGLFLNMTLTNK